MQNISPDRVGAGRSLSLSSPSSEPGSSIDDTRYIPPSSAGPWEPSRELREFTITEYINPAGRSLKLFLGLIDPEAEMLNDIVAQVKVIFLANPGVSINQPHSFAGWKQTTVLMACIANGQCKAALALLQQLHADPFIQDEQGKHVLHLLIAKGHKHGIDDHENQYPVFLQVLEHSSIAGNIKVQDVHGMTPLHYACARKDPEYIDLLIKKGADPYIQDMKGNNCFQIIKLAEQSRINLLGLALCHHDGDLIRDDYLKVSYGNYIANRPPSNFHFSPGIASASLDVASAGGEYLVFDVDPNNIAHVASVFDKDCVESTDEDLVKILCRSSGSQNSIFS